jgi:predicted N-acetyltransferase YhbS
MTDREQLLALYRVCFPEDDPQFWNWVFDRLYRPENTLNLRENGRIVASLQMIPCEMQLEDRRYAAHYIYAAATLPEWQGKGLMAGLLAQAADEGRRRGQAFSVLITQEDSLLEYYARFGYEGRCKIAVMPPVMEQPSTLHQCRMAVPADLAALTGLYEQASRGMLCGLRDEAFWRTQLDLFGKGAWVLEKQGRIMAYAFADERGIIEAAGPEAGLLAAKIAPGESWRTLPLQGGQPMGSIKPLDEKYRKIMEHNPCFLNLMYN